MALYGGQTIAINDSLSNSEVSLKLDTSGDLQLIIAQLNGASRQPVKKRGYLGKILWHTQTFRTGATK